MITNERQYKITRSHAKKFKHAIENFAISQSERTDVHPRLLQAWREGLESQLEDLTHEIKEYETLKASLRNDPV